MFDSTNIISLLNAEEWARNALSVVKSNEKQPFVFLIGTKIDLMVKTINIFIVKNHYYNSILLRIQPIPSLK